MAFHGLENKEVLMVLFIRRHLLTFISFSCGAELKAHPNAYFCKRFSINLSFNITIMKQYPRIFPEDLRKDTKNRQSGWSVLEPKIRNRDFPSNKRCGKDARQLSLP